MFGISRHDRAAADVAFTFGGGHSCRTHVRLLPIQDGPVLTFAVTRSPHRRQRAKRTEMSPQFGGRLHFRTIHDSVLSWLFGAGLLWRGYTAVVGSIIVVAVWATDRGGSAVIAGGVIS